MTMWDKLARKGTRTYFGFFFQLSLSITFLYHFLVKIGFLLTSYSNPIVFLQQKRATEQNEYDFRDQPLDNVLRHIDEVWENSYAIDPMTCHLH